MKYSEVQNAAKVWAKSRDETQKLNDKAIEIFNKWSDSTCHLGMNIIAYLRENPDIDSDNYPPPEPGCGLNHDPTYR